MFAASSLMSMPVDESSGAHYVLAPQLCVSPSHMQFSVDLLMSIDVIIIKLFRA